MKTIFAAIFSRILKAMITRAKPYLKCHHCGAMGDLIAPLSVECPQCGEQWDFVRTKRNGWKRIIIAEGNVV